MFTGKYRCPQCDQTDRGFLQEVRNCTVWHKVDNELDHRETDDWDKGHSVGHMCLSCYAQVSPEEIEVATNG